MKKLINDPRNVVTEMIDGLVAAYGGRVVRLEGVNAIVRRSIPQGKVALLVGGGSGHEPIYHGLVGENMADGAAIGNVFAAPGPEIVLEATRAVHRGAGVLYAYGNYAGDVMNFDMAAEMAADEGVEVRTVRIADDVAIAEREHRRGIAGLLFVVKIAGAAASALRSLAEVERVTGKAEAAVRTMGVALAAGSIPETGEPTFLLGDDEMEIGMGLHGEPGVARGPLRAADPVVDDMMARILSDLPFRRGDRVAVLLNDLGATTAMELLIMNRRVRQILDREGIAVHDTVIGKFCTCQEMAGASITLLRLDEELARFYDMSADSPAFRRP